MTSLFSFSFHTAFWMKLDGRPYKIYAASLSLKCMSLAFLLFHISVH